jgi:putative DNA primase/helicase
MPDLATRSGQQQLEDLLEGTDLLILDNLSALCRSGNENDGQDWLPVQEWILGLRRRGISVLFVHHSGKNKSQRGTSKREDLLDTVIALKNPSDYEASQGLRCEIHFEKVRSLIGEAARPFEVRMEGDPENGATWKISSVEDSNSLRAATLFEAGLSVRDVAEELSVSKSAAGRLRQKWSTANGNLVSRRPTV